MDRGTAIGLGLALISILGAAVVEAGSIGILFALLNLPSAMIVFGGTLDLSASGLLGSIIGAIIVLLIWRAMGGRRGVVS